MITESETITALVAFHSSLVDVMVQKMDEIFSLKIISLLNDL